MGIINDLLKKKGIFNVRRKHHNTCWIFYIEICIFLLKSAINTFYNCTIFTGTSSLSSDQALRSGTYPF